MFKSIKNRNILLILLNARITKRSFDRWSKFKKFSYSIFGLIDKAYSQNSETNHYLKRLNVKNIQSIGNIKFIEDPSLVSISLSTSINLYLSFLAKFFPIVVLPTPGDPVNASLTDPPTPSRDDKLTRTLPSKARHSPGILDTRSWLEVAMLFPSYAVISAAFLFHP